jgi:hypothetical protein
MLHGVDRQGSDQLAWIKHLFDIANGTRAPKWWRE